MLHFELQEFDSPDEKGSGKYMHDPFLQMLDDARAIAGIPFKINSGFRSESHNKYCGGKEKSSHLFGYAADIHCSDSRSRYIIFNALTQAGFKDGHCEGWRDEKGKNAYCPYAPYAPYPEYPQSSNSYRDGYNTGFKQGIRDARE